MNLIALICI